MATRKDGWHTGKHDAHYLTRNCVTVAVVFWRVGGWCWWNFIGDGHADHYLTREAAMAAAECALSSTDAEKAQTTASE